MAPIPVSKMYWIAPSLSYSAMQPSITENSEEVTVTPEPAAHVVESSSVVGTVVSSPVGVVESSSAGVVESSSAGVGVGPSQPQSTPKVVDVAASASDSPGKIPAARHHG